MTAQRSPWLYSQNRCKVRLLITFVFVQFVSAWHIFKPISRCPHTCGKTCCLFIDFSRLQSVKVIDYETVYLWEQKAHKLTRTAADTLTFNLDTCVTQTLLQSFTSVTRKLPHLHTAFLQEKHISYFQRHLFVS